MQQALESLYGKADELTESGMGRYEAIRKIVGIDERRPEIWAVEWHARISPEDWQNILVENFAIELERRAHNRRVEVAPGESQEDIDDGYTAEEFEANVASYITEAMGAWNRIKYQDTDHVSRTLRELSRDWYATGPADVAAGYRRVRIGEFKNQVHGELLQSNAQTPAELSDDKQDKFAGLADDIWGTGVR